MRMEKGKTQIFYDVTKRNCLIFVLSCDFKTCLRHNI